MGDNWINTILCTIVFLSLLLLGWKIYTKTKPLSKETTMTERVEIESILKEIHCEIALASQAFFAWKAIHNTASKDSSIHSSLNSNSLSWNIILHSLQATFFIAVGRIFDTDARSCSIHFLFRLCKDNIEAFSKTELKQRRMIGKNQEPDYLDDFIERAYKPQKSDFTSLKKEVTRVQNIYEKKFRTIRHKLFAHKDIDHIADTSALFKGTTIGDAEEILQTLYKVEKAIWALYTNGHTIDLDTWTLKEEEHILKDMKSLLNKI